MSSLLFVDTETGGLLPQKHSLLSVAFIVWKDSQILNKQSFYVKEDEYFITEEAKKINNINIDFLKSTSVEKKEIIKQIKYIKQKYFNNSKMTLAGQNVNFDYSFLKKMYEDENEDFSYDFNYRVLDISSILRFCFLTQKVSQDISALDDALKYFEIPVSCRHTAMADCEAVLEVFQKLINIIR